MDQNFILVDYIYQSILTRREGLFYIIFCYRIIIIILDVNAQYENVTINTTKITGNVFILIGSGGNIIVSVGQDGVFIVDDQFAYH